MRRSWLADSTRDKAKCSGAAPTNQAGRQNAIGVTALTALTAKGWGQNIAAVH